MIRSALIALGLSAGAAQGQGVVPTSPLLETCGGTRLVLEADGAVDTDTLDAASDVMSARIGGVYANIFDYTDVVDTQIVVSMPAGFQADEDMLRSLLRRVAFGFYEVDATVSTDEASPSEGQMALPSGDDPSITFILNDTPILDGSVINRAVPIFDANGAPAVSFRFNAVGAQVFGDFTTSNVGETFAIVLDGSVLSAPVIMSPILGGEGVLTGINTIDEAAVLSAVLRGGVVPFDVGVVAVEIMDGSDPSADFCP